MIDILGQVHWRDVQGRPVWRWAEVVETSPELSLMIDGDVAPIGAPPTVLAHVDALTVGDWVWCQITSGGSVVVIGKKA